MRKLVTQIRPHEDAAGIDAAAARLWTLTSGEPVTVGLHLQDIRARPEQGLVEWAASRDDTPTGLEGFFDTWLTEHRRLWESESSTRVDDAERVLRLLVTAEGPISRTDLRILVARLDERLDAVRLDRALAILGRFVLPGRSADTLVVAHPAITDTSQPGGATPATAQGGVGLPPGGRTLGLCGHRGR
jgi:hypothetical protein